MKRKTKKTIRNGILYLSFIVAIVIYTLAAVRLTFADFYGLLAMLLSGSYIIAFFAANEVC